MYVESEMDISLTGQQKVIDTDWQWGYRDRLTDICRLYSIQSSLAEMR